MSKSVIGAAAAVGAASAVACGIKDSDGGVFSSARGSAARAGLSGSLVEVAVLVVEDAIAACCRVRYSAGRVLLLSGVHSSLSDVAWVAGGIMLGVLTVIVVV